MYNPYENNNQPTNDVKKPEPPQTGREKVEQPTQNSQQGYQNNGYYSAYYGSNNPNNVQPPQNTYQPPQASSYTWNAQPKPVVNYKPPKKPSDKKLPLKILAVFICCIIASVGSVGAFAGLINAGVINVESSGDSENAAFTITKLIDNGDSDKNSQAVSGTVGELTNQEIAQKLIPSVVCIQNYQVTQQYGFYGTSDANESEVSPAGEGSGIILSEDGYIVTNQHVVEGATSLKVVLSDGKTYEAKLVGGDKITDLAVIKIEAEGLQPAEFGSANDLSVADEVLAIGNPGGMSFNSSVTIGYVSALNREILVGEDGYTMYCIQTDAAINPGNSGGALVNKYGQVIGINSSKIVASGYEGLGFAIPSDTVQPIVSDLKNYGYVKDRAILGITGQYIDNMTARFYGLTTGMYVATITSEGAAKSGLQKGDVITSIDGTQITSQATITTVVTQKKPGDTVEITVDRALEGQQGIKLTVVLSEYQQDTMVQPVPNGGGNG